MKYEIEIPIVPEGWEPVAFRVAARGENYINFRGLVDECTPEPKHLGLALIIKRKTRKYDWYKTHKDVLVFDNEDERIRTYSGDIFQGSMIARVWQPNITDECPVDPDACIVEAVYIDGNCHLPKLAEKVRWPRVKRWRFVKLAEGVVWS